MDFELKDKSETYGTCWIQFDISGTADKYSIWSDNSKYLDPDAFNLFVDIFEKHADIFHEFGPTFFSTLQLAEIANGILQRVRDLDRLQTIDDLIAYIPETARDRTLADELRDSYDQLYEQIDSLLNEIRILANRLTVLLNQCIANNKTLWVLGL